MFISAKRFCFLKSTHVHSNLGRPKHEISGSGRMIKLSQLHHLTNYIPLVFQVTYYVTPILCGPLIHHLLSSPLFPSSLLLPFFSPRRLVILIPLLRKPPPCQVQSPAVQERLLLIHPLLKWSLEIVKIEHYVFVTKTVADDSVVWPNTMREKNRSYFGQHEFPLLRTHQTPLGTAQTRHVG